jgi:superfamily I DNA/RNA helicase
LNQRAFNPAQREAIEHDGPLLIVAGPGSGKTTVMVERAARLLATPSTRLAMVTFTRDAADEMKARLRHRVDLSLRRCSIGTFHRLTIDQQRSEGKLGKLLMPGRQAELVRRAATRAGMGIEEASALIEACATDAEAADAPDAVTYYRKLKADLGVLDLWDVLRASVRMMASGQLRPLSVTHMLVDEFHDTDVVQYEWVMAHARNGTQITAVADDDQSIYAWRHGLGVAGMRRLVADTRCHQVTLRMNYRCRPEIVAASRRLIEHNTDRIPKDLVSSIEPGGSVELVRPESSRLEFEFLMRYIEPHLMEGAAPYLFTAPARRIAIIARTGFVLDEFGLQLRARGIKYVRNERDSQARSVAALLKLLLAMDGDDRVAIENLLMRLGWSEDAIAGLVKGSPGAIARLLDGNAGLPDDHGLVPLTRLTQAWRSQLRQGRVELVIVGAAAWVRTNGLLTVTARDERLLDLAENVLLEAGGSLSARVRRLEMPTHEIKGETDGVGLYTMHGSKGLEFDTVLVASVLDGVVPNARAANTPEERRLMYVAMTRARRNLVISAPRGAPASPFVDEAGLDLGGDPFGLQRGDKVLARAAVVTNA